MTYDDLRAEFIRWSANSDPEFLSSIDGFIRSAENLIATSVTLPSFSESTSIVLDSGLQTTTIIPSDFVAVENIFIPGYGSLEKKDPSFIMEAYPNGEAGPPRYFAMQSDVQVLWGPTPDQGYTGTLRYTSRPVSLCDNHAGTYISNRYEVALKHGAFSFGALWMNDYELATSHEAVATRSLGNAVAFVKGRAKKQDFEKANNAVESGEIV